ncbi:MAG: hypothetical protein IPK59_00130 [Rhodospirillaceae bacterium]|nr:hypothetical protein [Rhodospirillaceae bacterium]
MHLDAAASAQVANAPKPDYPASMFTAHPESVALLRWCQQTVSAARSGRVLAALCLSALLLAAQPGPAAAQDAVGANGQLFDDFGRLTLDWAKATPPEVEIDLGDQEMVLRFARPVVVDPAAIRANLKAYIRNATLSADAMTLTLALKKPVTYRLDRSGARLQLDLAQPGEAVFPNKASAVAAQPPAPQPAAPSTSAAPAEGALPTTASPAPGSGPTLKLRSGEHSGYSRLAIDWPGVDFTVQQNGDTAFVSFSKPGRLDSATRLPPRLRSVTATSTAKGGLGLELKLLPNVGLNAFRNGATVVIDLVDGKAAATTAPAPAEPPAPPVVEAPAAETPVAETPKAETPVVEKPAAEPPPVEAPAVASAETVAPALQSEPPVALDAPQADAVPPASAPVEIAPPVVVTMNRQRRPSRSRQRRSRSSPAPSRRKMGRC